MIAAVGFMACAALRAQGAYSRRNDGPLAVQLYVSSEVRLGAAGIACFVAAKVLA